MSLTRDRWRAATPLGYFLAVTIVALGRAIAQENDQQACRQSGNPDRNIPACNRIIDSKPQNPDDLADAYLFRAAGYRNKGQFDAALKDADTALQLNPNLAEAYVVRGMVYILTKRIDDAIKDFTVGLRLNPNHAEAHRQRASAYMIKQDAAAAVRDFDEVVRLEPRSAAAYYLRGSAYGLTGQQERAFADYGMAVKLEPDNPMGLTALGNAYLEGLGTGKDRDRGIELLRKAARTGFPPAKEILAKAGQPVQ